MTEHQLSRLLHEQTPEPPASIDLEELAARIQAPPAPARPRRRWLTPVTAAAAVVTVVAAGAGVAALTRGSGPVPTTSSLPNSAESTLGALSTGGTPTAGGTVGRPVPASGKTAEPALAWARQVVKRWEEQTANQPFVPLGPADAWTFERLGGTAGKERPYAEALEARTIVSGTALSSQPPAAGTVRWDDGSTNPVTVLSAKNGFDNLLRGATRCTKCPTGTKETPTLSVTSATLTTMRIETTRGEATIPAWRFSFAGTRLQALQAAVTARVATPVMTSSQPIADSIVPATRAELAADGVTLTVHLNGVYNPAAKICGADYTGYAVESERAVGILVTQRRNPAVVPCPNGRADRTVTVTLSTPLKDRAVLDTAHGTPIPVTRH